MKKSSLLRNTSILMIATIVSRVIGLLYRSPLGAAIGSEGLGYYGTASNVYVILLLISSARKRVFSKIVSSGRKFTFVPVFLVFPVIGRSPSSNSTTGTPLSYPS